MKKLIGFGVLFFIILHLFGAMAFMGRSHYGSADIAREAWSQGYIAGQQAATGEDGATPNAVPPSPMESHGLHGHGGYESYGHNGRYGMTPFSVFGMLFRCLLPLFLIGGLFMFFGKRRCRRHHGEGGHHHDHGGHRGHGCGHRPPWAGHRPPWARHDGEGNDEHAPRWVTEDDPAEDDLPTADEIHEKSPEDLE